MDRLSRLPGDHLRLRFLERVLADDEGAERADARGEWLMGALVGASPRRRDLAADFLRRQTVAAGLTERVRWTAALLAVELEVTDPTVQRVALRGLLGLPDSEKVLLLREHRRQRLVDLLARMDGGCLEEATDALLEDLTRQLDAMNPRPTGRVGESEFASDPQNGYVIGGFTGLAGLDATACSRVADALLVALGRCRTSPQSTFLAEALTALAPGLDAAAASRHADALLVSLAREPDLYKVEAMGQCIVALAAPMGPAAAAPRASAAAAAWLAAESRGTPNERQVMRMTTFAALAARMDEPAGTRTASKAANRILVALGRAADPSTTRAPIHDLIALADLLDAVTVRRAADVLVARLDRPAGDDQGYEVVRGITALAGRLDSAVAARIADALTARVLAARDYNRAESVSVLRSLADRLNAAAVARTAESLLTALGSDLLEVHPGELLNAFTPLGGRLDEASTARAAEILVAGLAREKEPVARARWAAAIASLGDAASTSRATEILLAALERETGGDHVAYLVDGVVPLAARLDTPARAAAISRATAALLAALDRDWAPLHSQGEGVTGLAPAAPQVAEALVRKFVRSDGRIWHQNGVALTAACTKLDLPALTRLLAHPSATPESNRAVLDALGMRLRMRFRNTWHFIDWARANGVDVIAMIK